MQVIADVESQGISLVPLDSSIDNCCYKCVKNNSYMQAVSDSPLLVHGFGKQIFGKPLDRANSVVILPYIMIL